MKFEKFILNEANEIIAKKTGDVLSSLQELKSDIKSLSRRSTERAIAKTVNSIRNIIHGKKKNSDEKLFKLLQKIGVSLMVGLEKTGTDLESVLTSAVSELEEVLKNMDLPPISDIGERDDNPPSDNEENFSNEIPA